MKYTDKELREKLKYAKQCRCLVCSPVIVLIEDLLETRKALRDVLILMEKEEIFDEL